MDPHGKRSLLWGVVGLFSFLVLIQAFELVTGDVVDWGIKAVVALLVGVAATAITHRTEDRLPGNESP